MWGYARQTSNGLCQLYEHAIPHLGSKGLVGELDTQALCKCTASLSIWGNVIHSLFHFVSLCKCISILRFRSFALQVSPSFWLHVPRCLALSLSASMHLNASPSYSSARFLSKFLLVSGYMSLALLLSVSLSQRISILLVRSFSLQVSPSLWLHVPRSLSLSLALSA